YQIVYPTPDASEPDAKARKRPRDVAWRSGTSGAITRIANRADQAKLPAVCGRGVRLCAPSSEYRPQQGPAKIMRLDPAGSGAARETGGGGSAGGPGAGPSQSPRAGRSPRKRPTLTIVICTAAKSMSAPMAAPIREYALVKASMYPASTSPAVADPRSSSERG